MRRWLPHVHVGGSSDECVHDGEGGREGWYVMVCWLGLMVSLTFGSIYAERRMMDEIRREREEREAVAAEGEGAQSGGPTTGESR